MATTAVRKYNPVLNMPDVSVKASDPTVPTGEHSYALDRLNRVVRLNTTNIFQGIDEPAFDESFRPLDLVEELKAVGLPGGMTKDWIDTAPFENGLALDAPVIYFYWSPLEQKAKKFTLTVYQAAVFNVPGLHNYPVYKEPVTSAFLIAPTGGIYAVRAEYLSEKADADALLAEIQKDVKDFKGTAKEMPYPDPGQVLWAGDTKRPYAIGETFVSTLLKNRNSKGVGVPGTWSVAQGQLVWEFDPTPEQVAGNCPMPIRLPVPGVEEIHQDGAFGAVYVVQKGVVAPGTGGSGGGVFEKAVMARFDLVDAALVKINEGLFGKKK